MPGRKKKKRSPKRKRMLSDISDVSMDSPKPNTNDPDVPDEAENANAMSTEVEMEMKMADEIEDSKRAQASKVADANYEAKKTQDEVDTKKAPVGKFIKTVR